MHSGAYTLVLSLGKMWTFIDKEVQEAYYIGKLMMTFVMNGPYEDCKPTANLNAKNDAMLKFYN